MGMVNIINTISGGFNETVHTTKRQRQEYYRSISHMLTVKIRQPSHEFTFGVGISFMPYPLVLTPVV
jgi:hypothetical protein